MPGLQVNNKGEITAQGQKVEKVLVDGEEFFSDDPAVVTANLRADAVDKVQVFDKKSDQAVFSGIDDGVKTKTINLQLKEDKKKGYFGKAEAGTNASGLNMGKGMINAFKGKRKFAAYATKDNTKYESLNWQERRNYGEDLNTTTEFMDGGGMMMYYEGDDFSEGNGLPNSTTAGAHFNSKWNNDKKNSVNTYQFNRVNVVGATASINQNILGNNLSIFNRTNENYEQTKTRNRLQSVYDWTIDSTSSLKLTIKGTIINNQQFRKTIGAATNNSNELLNANNRTTQFDEDNQQFFSSAFWRKRFKKKGRTISINADWNKANREGNGLLTANNLFYNKLGAVSNTEIVDQQKTNNENSYSLNSKISYTEPLSDKTFLEWNYRFSNSRNNAERNTFVKAPGGTNYNFLVDSLSNHLIFNNNQHSTGLTFRLNQKKYSFYFGSNLGIANYDVNDLRTLKDRNIRFTNFLPTVGLNLNPAKQTRFSFSYNGSTQNPTIQQIQPIIDNIDPLNIQIGNKNLQQAFRHNFNINFSDYKILKSRNIWISANFSTVNNAITNSVNVDSVGRRINQTVNVNGNYNGSMWASYGFEVLPSVNLNFSINPSINRFINIVNGVENINDNHRFAGTVSVGYWPDKWLNFWTDFEFSVNNTKSSLNKGFNTKFWQINSNANISMKLPKKFYVEINGNINVYQRTAAFANTPNLFIINAHVKKTFPKSTEKFEAKLAVNDLLNQNQGINRNISSNFIAETQNVVLRRFVLFSFAMNISKNAKPSN